MLEKQIDVDKIEVTDDGVIHVRQRTRILENGEESIKAYHRTALMPGDDLTGQDARVVAVCTAVWTSNVVETYRAKLAALEEGNI